MDWKDVAKVVAPLAPTLGGLIGGIIPFPGAGLAGQALGALIAKQFGVPATPEAVHKAVTENPNEVVLAKLNAVMEEAKARWPALAEMEKAWAERDARVTEAVNATMRAEQGREHWFFNGWRPAAGWLFNIFAVVYGALLVYAVAWSEPMLTAIERVQFIAGAHLGALAAIVGVYVFGRSSEKGKAVEATGSTTVTPPVPPRKPAPPAPPPAPPPRVVERGVFPEPDRHANH